MAGEGDAERLVVLLEARVRDFEKNMQKASGTAGTSYNRMRRDSRSATRQMEADMTRSTRVINRALASTSTQIGALGRSFAGAFAGGIFAGGAAGLARGVRGIVSELSELGKQMDRVGLSAKVFQELRFGFELAGVSADEFTTGMEQFTRRIGEAATRGGRLADILKANGVAMRDQAGNIRSNEALLRDYAELIKNAGSEQEALVLATEAFGRGGASFVNALKDGAASIDDMARAADEAGGTIDEALIRKAEELDDRFASMWRTFEINSKSAIMTAIAYLDNFQSKLNEIGNNSFFRWLSERAGTDGAVFVPGQGVFNPGSDEMTPDARIASAFSGAVQDADQALVEQLRARYGHAVETAATTVLPGVTVRDRSGGGGSRSRNRAAEAALREAEAVAKLIEQLNHELSLVGVGDLEKAKANALRQAGAAATDQQRAEIERLVTALYEEEQATKAAADAAAELREIGRDVMGGIISDLREGKNAAEIFANALDKVANRLIDIALNSMFGGFGGGMGRGGLLGGMIIPGILHDGGVAGRDGYGHGRAVPASVFAGAPRYHQGGVAGLRPGEVPAILERGERIIPKGGATEQRSVVEVQLSRELEGRILQRAAHQSVAIVKQTAPGIVDSSVKEVRRAMRNNPGFNR